MSGSTPTTSSTRTAGRTTWPPGGTRSTGTPSTSATARPRAGRNILSSDVEPGRQRPGFVVGVPMAGNAGPFPRHPIHAILAPIEYDRREAWDGLWTVGAGRAAERQGARLEVRGA